MTTDLLTEDLLEPIRRLTRDIKDASRLLGQREARYLVDCYYQIQDFRIVAAARVRGSDEDEPNRVLSWVFDCMEILENDIKRALGTFASEYNVGQWLQSICGIGPVISAGFLAHLDIRGCATAGHFWRFAGLDPTMKWVKKTKRPWNAGLKTLCWKAGESFVKVQNNDKDVYGKLFVERKLFEQQRNEAGGNELRAAEILAGKKFGKDTEAYKAYSVGLLPKAHIHAQARRWTVKMFLSHYWQRAWVQAHPGKMPPNAWVIEHGGHVHYVEPEVPFTE